MFVVNASVEKGDDSVITVERVAKSKLRITLFTKTSFINDIINVFLQEDRGKKEYTQLILISFFKGNKCIKFEEQ